MALKKVKNKTVSKSKKSIIRAKLALIKAASPNLAFARIRETIPLSAIDDFVDWIVRSSLIYKKTIGNPYPMSAEEWNSLYIPEEIIAKKEFAWSCAILMKHSNKISSFISNSQPNLKLLKTLTI